MLVYLLVYQFASSGSQCQTVIAEGKRTAMRLLRGNRFWLRIIPVRRTSHATLL